MSNVKVIVYDGKEHRLIPSQWLLRSRPRGVQTGGAWAGPVLFEPIMNVRIVAPSAHGDVMGI